MQTKIYVNAEAGVIVCKVYEITSKWTDLDGKKHYDLDYLCSAKVSVKNGDVFDEKKGKRIAYAKAMSKACDKIMKRDYKYIERLEKYIKETQEKIAHNEEVKEYYDNKYNELAE